MTDSGARVASSWALPMKRRDLCLSLAGSTLSALAGCQPPSPEAPAAPLACERPAAGEDFDYIVIGSGAGGGPLAARLALAGYRVLLLEAGGDPEAATRDIPALHARSVEEPEMSWDFFVRTYEDDVRQRRNPRFVQKEGGVLYPRAATLGGCTAHNAMIAIVPHDRDWDDLAALVDDPSFEASNMRGYFERLERCAYAPRSGAESARHGFDGWLSTEVADPSLVTGDPDLMATIDGALEEAARGDEFALANALGMALDPSRALWDPNDARVQREGGEGMFFIPMHTHNGARTGARERVLSVSQACEKNLTIELHALVTRIVFDGLRAVAVEFEKGRYLYEASTVRRDSSTHSGALERVRARREIIVSAGVFNSPQILMLSGLGPRQHLEEHGIEVLVDLPGVGQNLQDRYEVSVVAELASDLAALDGASFRDPQAPNAPANDRALVEWLRHRTGPYTANGILGAIARRSRPEEPSPDLFMFGVIGRFAGYYPGFSDDLLADKRHLSWAVLKAHTNNTAGSVTLASANPRERPRIDFRYFDEGSPGWERDLDAVVDGLIAARRMMGWLGSSVVREVLPGPEVGTREELARFVRDHAWGHHAACTNKMGAASDPMAVVDSQFRVRGVDGLRVVDASVFPKLPGFFPVVAVMMLAEKAADAILDETDTLARPSSH
ncbi:MAG: GMC family oxidoreductase N-terminal domain-containing protein [Polyangiaceae bacterium]